MSEEEDIDVVGTNECDTFEFNVEEEKNVQLQNKSCLKVSRRTWTEDEKHLFFQGIELFGRKWSKISNFIGSKTTIQVKSFAYHSLKKEKKSTSHHCISKGATGDSHGSDIFTKTELSTSTENIEAFSVNELEENSTLNKMVMMSKSDTTANLKDSLVTVQAQNSEDSDQDIIVDDDLNLTVSGKNLFSSSASSPHLYDEIEIKSPKDSSTKEDKQNKEGTIVKERLRIRKKKPGVLEESAIRRGGYTFEHDADGSVVKETVRVKSSTPKRPRADPHKLVFCKELPEDEHVPYKIEMTIDCLLIMDIHAHSLCTESIGMLGGSYEKDTKKLQICVAEPCDSLSTKTNCEMDPVSQLKASNSLQQNNYEVVGWYHCHPTFSPYPSVEDLESQTKHQDLFHVQKEQPFVAIIISPYFKNCVQSSSETVNSTFNCVALIDSESDNSCPEKIPFRFNVSLTTNSEKGLSITTWTRIECLLFKIKDHPDRFNLLGKCKEYGEVSYLEKLLLSLKHHMNCAGIKHQDLEAAAEKIKTMILSVVENTS